MWKTPTLLMPLISCKVFLTLVATFSNSSMSGPKILTELSPLMPDIASITLSRMFCEKFQTTPGSLRSSSPFISATSSGFVRGRLFQKKGN